MERERFGQAGVLNRGNLGRRILSSSGVLCLFTWGVVVAAVAIVGCGGQDSSQASVGNQESVGEVVVEESGTISAGDSKDPNYGDSLYDGYIFEADKFDRVRIEVAADGFAPLLLLVETSTGAQLWEWQDEYSDDDALLYTIAEPGTFEARVYALEDAMGDYRLTVTLND